MSVLSESALFSHQSLTSSVDISDSLQPSSSNGSMFLVLLQPYLPPFSYLFLFLFPSNMLSVVNNTRFTPVVSRDSSILFFLSYRALNLSKVSPQSLLMRRNFFFAVVAFQTGNAQNSLEIKSGIGLDRNPCLRWK